MNYLVWLHGLRGPAAQLHARNPRESIDWASLEPSIIAIIELPEAERDYTLDQAIAAHPCPLVA